MKPKNSCAVLLTLLCWSSLGYTTTTDEQISQLNRQIGELSVQIRAANSNAEREKAAELRDQREALQEQLRDLHRQAREQKKADSQSSKRAATDKEWATFAPDKQLCTAIQYNRLDLVQKVMASGAIDLRKNNEHCFFPLAEAAAQGHIEIAEFLLQQKSPLTMQAPFFQTPVSALDAAASSKHDRTLMLDLLKKYGGTMVGSEEASLPSAIIGEGGPQNQKILREKFNVTTRQLSSGSTLAKALEEGHLHNILWLLEQGANPNDAMLGRTALMIAVDSNDLDKVSALVNAGADVNQRGLNYVSLLTYAEKRQSRVGGSKKVAMDEIIAYLKSKGATRSEQEIASGQNS